MRKILALVGALPMVFTMCQGGKAPEGCCKHGDRLDIVITQKDWERECDRMGGFPILEIRGTVSHEVPVHLCRGVDF